ncbi:protein zwilch homolog isoform X1 [Asterias amurensis]|uniref:protein zwilch homolog isoform X1 n=1 Tax=Asterias amurensis TaxID=7602 RepID=UPI003AB4A3EC
MKNFTADINEFLATIKELLSSESQNTSVNNGKTSSAVFKDFKFCLTNYSSKEVSELMLESNQRPAKNSKVVLVQKEDLLKHLEKEDISLNDESMEETEGTLGDSIRNEGEDSSLRDPVSVDEARYLLSIHNLCTNPNRSLTLDKSTELTVPDMLVICDGKDNENIAVMGCSSVKAGSGDHRGQWSPGVSVTTVSCFGPVTSKSSLLTVDQVIQQSGSLANKESVSTTAFAQYEIVGMSYHEVSMLDVASQTHTSVTMDCSWDNVKGMLERPHSAMCNVHVCAVAGDMRSAAHSMYRELATLVGFTEGLKTEELEWNTKESSKESVEEAVARLIEKEKQGPQRKPEPKPQTPIQDGETDLDSLLRCYVIPERQDLYFSESLWTTLWSTATCYDDFIRAFSLVFSELRKGELQPIVHGDNQSTLAKMIRASYQQEMNKINIEGVDNLTMLVEIGLDKLRRDYTNFFIASELTTLNQLQWYVKTSESCGIIEQVSRLRALHNVLEVAVVSVTSLKLPPEHRRSLVRSALIYYQSHPEDDCHTFSQPVEATILQPLYTSYQPSVWRLNVKGNAGTCSSYQLSVKQPLQHVIGINPDMSMGDLTSGETFCYHVAHSRENTVSFL